ncbi:type VII secretion system-associated protein [Streptomyces sp. WSLK1-5]|uniref:type VII secretion system-associated protein n=1 Tax=unclassified Streptomyces TaxID=2593676 RepID=UPI00379AF366
MSKPTDRDEATHQPDDDAQRIEGATENMPPVPDEIREAAKLAPDHWLGMVDPTWNGEGPPPAWAVVGQWRSGLDGEIVEWQDNEEYRPSPKALGWPEPADDVDAAVQLAATGYGPGEDVTRALAELSEAAVFVTPHGDPLPATAPDGETPVVPLFTSPVYLHTSGRLAFELMPVSDVLDRLPEGHLLYLNPSAPVSMTVETDALREALAGDTAEAPGGEAADHVVPSRPATTSGSAGVARPSSEGRGAEEDVSSETVQSVL